MSKLITEEQFVKALNISTKCAKKKWQHSTDMMIANTIAQAKDKNKVIDQLQTMVEEIQDEKEFIKKLKCL